MLLTLLLNFVVRGSSAPVGGKKTSYDETDARKLYNLAAGSYGNNIQQCIDRRYPASNGLSVLQTIERKCDILGDLCGSFIAKSDVNKELIVVFRGTISEKQLAFEGVVSLLPARDFLGIGVVNAYFLNAHESLWSDVAAVLNQSQYKNYNVVFTGHSLGGAIASLAAAQTVKENLRNGSQVRLLTFGEPRVGNLQYAKSFDSLVANSFRVIHKNDMIPHLRSCEKDMSNKNLTDKDSRPCDATSNEKFYHHGTEIWYPDTMTSGAQYMECLGLPKNEDFSCSDSFKFELKDGKEYFDEHMHYFEVQVEDYGRSGCDPSYNSTSTYVNKILQKP